MDVTLVDIHTTPRATHRLGFVFSLMPCRSWSVSRAFKIGAMILSAVHGSNNGRLREKWFAFYRGWPAA